MNAPEKLSIYAKLQQARIQLQSVQLKKSGNNKFAGYQYFELGDFLPAVNTIFHELGLCGIVSFGKEEATLRIVDTASNSEVVFTSPMAEAQLKGCHPVQNLGATQTYLRRYLYVTALEIVEHDALDATTGKDEKKTKAITPVASVVDSDPLVAQILNDPEEADFLRSIAAELVQMVEVENKPKAAVERVKSLNLQNEEKVALWSILQPNSKTRAALKKPNQEELAGQM